MMVDYQTLKSLAFTFAPFLISYAFSKYRSLQVQAATSPPLLRRALPPRVRNALHLLFAGVVLNFILSLPYFSPENIFSLTSSRIQTPSDVLFRRLAMLRPGKVLTADDQTLQSRMVSVDSRYLYLTFGPDPIINCPFCSFSAPSAGDASSSSSSSQHLTYLIYSLPTLLAPHLLNTLLLAVATSSVLSGKEGSRWRRQAVLASFVLSALDVAALNYYDWRANSRATHAGLIVAFYWNLRSGRFIALALLDALFAGLLWVTGTNRLFAVPYSPAERIEMIIAQLEQGLSQKLAAVGIVRNAAVRSEALRERGARYWAEEGEVMREIMTEDEGVREALRGALGGARLDMERVEREAKAYADGLVATLMVGEKGQGQEHGHGHGQGQDE